jgi:hypothetical protein
MSEDKLHENRKIVVTDPDVSVMRPVAVEVYHNWSQMETTHVNFEESADLIVKLAAFLKANGQPVPDISQYMS